MQPIISENKVSEYEHTDLRVMHVSDLLHKVTTHIIMPTTLFNLCREGVRERPTAHNWIQNAFNEINCVQLCQFGNRYR